MANISTDFSTWSGTAASNQPDSGDTATVQADLQAIQAALRTVFPSVNAAVTPTHTELNYVDGVTSAIQTQLNAKAATGANSDITSLSGLTTPLSVAQGGTGLDSAGTSGNVLTSNGSAWVSSASSGITSDTAQAMNTLSSHSFTGIPSTVKRIIVMFQAISLSGTDSVLIQAIVSGSPVTSGYTSTGINVSNASTSTGGSSTSGFVLSLNSSAGSLFSGMMVLTRLTGNTWTGSYTGKLATTIASFGGGDIDLAGTIEGIKILTTGANTFDGGYVNIMYE